MSIFALLSFQSAFALCLDVPFEDQVHSAKLIFVGTLRSERGVRLNNTIATRYLFSNLRYVKGRGLPDSVALFQDGGSVEGQGLFMEDAVKFEVGRRYVVFADSGGWGRPKEYSPSLCGLGPFEIGADSGRADQVVHSASGASMVAYDGQHLVMLLPFPWANQGPTRVDPDGTEHPPAKPPRLPLEEAIQASDAEYRGRLEGYGTVDMAKAMKHIRYVFLYPHQDPGGRLGENEFVTFLARIAEVAR